MNRALKTTGSPHQLADPCPIEEQELAAATSDKTHKSPAEIALSASRVRSAASCSSAHVAAALASTVERWRNPAYPHRCEAVSQLAAATGITSPSLEESLDALFAPATRDSLASLAPRLPRTDRLLGFIMAGNVPGAGIHEICAALLAGAGLLIKTASTEPSFFPSFIRTLAEVDAAVAARVTVMNFSRDDESAMRELWRCSDGGVVAY
ncbi:MAG TPA: acyl-CoA reductase, partial [Candidatus Binataceae bacterium]|nr:acyl-CoA reductase [Candidatus Binataceae bacterium]